MDSIRVGVLYFIYGAGVLIGLVIELLLGIALTASHAFRGVFSLDGFYEAEALLGFVGGFKKLIKGEL